MTTALIPREVLFGNPERSAPTVSPDGTRVAFLAPVEGVLNVWVGTDVETAQPVTDDRDRGVRTYEWAFDGQHLLYLQDRGGDENWRLFSVDLDAGTTIDVTPFDGIQTQLIKLSPRRPGEVLVGINRRDAAYHDVYLADVTTGACELVHENPGFAAPWGSPWIADDELEIRAAGRGAATGAGAELCVPVGDGWEVLLEFDDEDALSSWPIELTGDGKSLLVLSPSGAATTRLLRVDLASRAVEVLAADPDFDVADVHLHPDTKEPQVVTVRKERRALTAVDPSVADDLAAMQGLGEGDLLLQGSDLEDRRWLVTLERADGPASTYLFDRSTQHAAWLFDDRPELARYTLSQMEPFTFESRDGLTVHGYLTFPAGVDRAGLATVLLVHGGPWARDTWRFDPIAQWLANRGYLCVQVNFRGSTGYGKAFTNAGDLEWASRMHDDLLDAIDHAVARGYADRARVGIFGGSYGGYAALVGATFTPDVFACAVDIVGPSNLITLLESIPPYWVGIAEQFRRRVGDLDTGRDFLWSRSPLSRVDQLRIPLLIAQGANDPRVKQAEAEQIVAALESRGIPYEYLLYPDEGHGFAKPENRLHFYAAADRFLAEHLGGRAEG
jgi:dipeptidyl aminopeptidase/acylaminoacyl peptidase